MPGGRRLVAVSYRVDEETGRIYREALGGDAEVADVLVVSLRGEQVRGLVRREDYLAAP